GYGGQAGHFTVREAAHPVPDERSQAAAQGALDLIGRLSKEDLVLVLVSGGGSALLSAPWGLSLEDKRATNQALLRCGAAIGEINAVRKHLSRVKGGQLAGATAARILALVLSDVPGDDLAAVASGPTVPDPTTFADALAVLDRYGLELPVARAHLERGARGELPETPKPGDTSFARVENRLIAGGWQLLDAAAGFWRADGGRSRAAQSGTPEVPAVATLSDRFGGEARELARFHANLVQSIRAHHAPFRPPLVLLSGGEASVTVRGDGLGGRNQEFLLWLAHYLGDDGVWAIACDSDGIDGTTDAAGALITPDTLARAATRGLDPVRSLERNDAHHVFTELDDVIRTGATRHNLNDYRAILVTA
ncbi:MAG: glycerate kinase, partial [Actinomycetota bacterium]|nr:glycerate kinase [Actinomycetota bacterium]